MWFKLLTKIKCTLFLNLLFRFSTLTFWFRVQEAESWLCGLVKEEEAWFVVYGNWWRDCQLYHVSSTLNLLVSSSINFLFQSLMLCLWILFYCNNLKKDHHQLTFETPGNQFFAQNFNLLNVTNWKRIWYVC